MWYTSAPNTLSFDILLLCNNILRNDTILRATEIDPLLLLTYCMLHGDR